MRKDKLKVIGITVTVISLLLGGAVPPSVADFTPAQISEWREASKRGKAWAQYNLGLAYWRGEGVTKDRRETVKWYRKAAEQGFSSAQYNLGLAYWVGEGVKRDMREAVNWYSKAAEQGHANAQYNLGVAYDTGEGVTQGYSEAVKWHRKAAEQGIANAQAALGTAFLVGEGVIADHYEAYIWFAIAKANGDEGAAEIFSAINWNKSLSHAELKAANHEAATRLVDIDARTAEAESASGSDRSVQLATVIPKPDAAAKVFDSVWQSIVYIQSGTGHGSGVIIGANRVATNCHVVDGKRVKVFPPQSRQATADTGISARIKTRDTVRDFCTLRVPGVGGVVATARRFATLKIGETVYALGAPKGLELTLSRGLISQLRERNGKRIIQTDTAISPGSSGGGLFDSTGNLVGIMTSKISDESVEGISFAIPADLILE